MSLLADLVRMRERGVLRLPARHLAATMALALVVAVVLTVDPSGVGPIGGEAAIASTPPRVTGVQDVAHRSAFSQTTSKSTFVLCPEGKQVLGGGADAINENSKVALTEVRPFRATNGSYGYAASASTPYASTAAGDWALEVYALCADPVPGWDIVIATTPSSSTAKQATAAACPSDQRALGTGASIRFHAEDGVVYNHGIGLQVARASGSGDIARAQAREVPEGYPHPWQLSAYAVCADTPQSYEVVYGPSPWTGSETAKTAYTRCPDWYEVSGDFVITHQKQTIGMGAAVPDTAPGNVTLNQIAPEVNEAYDLLWVKAHAAENTSTGASWDLVVQVICVK